MKRYGNLWNEIIDYSNLLSAARKAQKGKRFRDSVLSFNYNLENELLQLKVELETQIYEPGAYKTFTILEPKPRIISAAPYRDRIVHHAIHNIVQPIFERGFIFDSYANRVGFGTHRGLRRFTEFARSSTYILQCDIKKYFATIDHEILKNLVRNKIKCIDTLWLIDKVIDNSNPQELVIEYFPGDELLTPTQRRRGLPIGNLTSQFLSNVYLNEFDHFIKRQLKIEKYIRYVDDFALFGENKQALAESKIAIEKYLIQLRLKLHPIKSQLSKTNHGANFLGFRILPDRIRVRAENLKRSRRRLRRMQLNYNQGQIPQEEVSQSLQSWIAHLKHGNTWQLRKKIFSTIVFVRE
jgi:retron-type reverse transcriptase